MTSSELKFDGNEKVIQLQCNLFIDDFAPAVTETLFDGLSNGNVSDGDKKMIQFYFQAKYRIFVNDKLLKLKLKRHLVEQNVISVFFEAKLKSFSKGDKLRIENELLFEKFGPLQTNWVVLKLPPDLPNFTYQSKLEDYIYKHTFLK